MDSRKRNKFTSQYYMLQIFDKGQWRDMCRVTPSNASRLAREGAKRNKAKHRVINELGEVIVEAYPK